MKVWLIGKNGMLAKAIHRALKNNNISYVSSSQRQADVTSLTSLNSFAKGQNITHLINCSAYTDVEGAEKEKEKAFSINSLGAENLGIWAKDHDVHVIHFSTDYVFDGKANMPYSEKSPCHPINYYGYTKYLGEKKLLDKHEKACIIRTSWLFGYGKEHFPLKMFQLMKINSKLKVVNDQIGRPTFCEDLASICLKMFPYCGVFHFANQGALSRYDFALWLQKFFLQENISLQCSKIQAVPSNLFSIRTIRPKYSVLATTKLEAALKLTPRNWTDCIREYFQVEHGFSCS